MERGLMRLANLKWPIRINVLASTSSHKGNFCFVSENEMNQKSISKG